MAGIAQGLERLTVAQEAAGSRPAIRPNPLKNQLHWNLPFERIYVTPTRFRTVEFHLAPTLGLSRRPRQRSAAQQVNVQVIDGLSAVFPLVDHQPIAVRKTLLLSDRLSCIEQVQMVARLGQSRDAADLLPGNDDNVYRRERNDVLKCNNMFVLVDNRSGNFAIDDLREQGRHTCILAQNSRQQS